MPPKAVPSLNQLENEIEATYNRARNSADTLLRTFDYLSNEEGLDRKQDVPEQRTRRSGAIRNNVANYQIDEDIISVPLPSSETEIKQREIKNPTRAPMRTKVLTRRRGPSLAQAEQLDQTISLLENNMEDDDRKLLDRYLNGDLLGSRNFKTIKSKISKILEGNGYTRGQKASFTRSLNNRHKNVEQPYSQDELTEAPDDPRPMVADSDGPPPRDTRLSATPTYESFDDVKRLLEESKTRPQYSRSSTFRPYKNKYSAPAPSDFSDLNDEDVKDTAAGVKDTKSRDLLLELSKRRDRYISPRMKKILFRAIAFVLGGGSLSQAAYSSLEAYIDDGIDVDIPIPAAEPEPEPKPEPEPESEVKVKAHTSDFYTVPVSNVAEESDGDPGERVWAPYIISPDVEILEKTKQELKQEQLSLARFDFINPRNIADLNPTGENPLYIQSNNNNVVRFMDWREHNNKLNNFINNEEESTLRTQMANLNAIRNDIYNNFIPSGEPQQTRDNYMIYNPNPYMVVTSPYRDMTINNGLNQDIEGSILYGRVP